LHPFCIAYWRLVSFADDNIAEQIDHRSRDRIVSNIHRACESLQNEMIAVAIDDHAGQTVTLAPHDAPQLSIDLPPVAIIGRLRNSAPKELKIQILPAPRETTRHNL